MSKIQGGALLAKSMSEKGIKKVFSLAGGFLNPIFDGCLDYGIDVVGTRSEQEAGFLAVGWTRVTREPCVCLAEPSGVTNYVSAVAEAYIAGDPVIFIGVSSIFHRLDRKGFKEIPEERIVEQIAKYSVLVNDGARIPEFFDKAYNIATNQPTGPVQLSVPINFLYSSKYDTEAKENTRPFDLGKGKKVHQSPPNSDDLALAEKTLKEAKKPVIIAGPGVYWGKSEKALEDFSASAGIPVFLPPWHHKSIDFTHPLCMGMADIHISPASRLIYEEADVVLFIGCSIDYAVDFGEPPLFNPKSKMIAVNFTARELADNHIADIEIMGDLKLFLDNLKSSIGSWKADEAWVKHLLARREADNKKTIDDAELNGVPVHPLKVCLDVLYSLGEEDYVVIDGGDIDGWLHTALQIWSLDRKRIRGVLHSGAFHQLGVGVSFATTAKMNHPESKVVLISGDGTFGLNPGLPLETAIHNKLPITVVIANDARWGQIQAQQETLWERTNATDNRMVPFYKMIEGTGGHGELVEDPNDFKPALERCFASGVPSLIDVRTLRCRSTITQGFIDKRERSSLE